MNSFVMCARFDANKFQYVCLNVHTIYIFFFFVDVVVVVVGTIGSATTSSNIYYCGFYFDVVINILNGNHHAYSCFLLFWRAIKCATE